MEEVGGTIDISIFQMFFVLGLYCMAAGPAYDVKGEIMLRPFHSSRLCNS